MLISSTRVRLQEWHCLKKWEKTRSRFKNYDSVLLFSVFWKSFQTCWLSAFSQTIIQLETLGLCRGGLIISLIIFIGLVERRRETGRSDFNQSSMPLIIRIQRVYTFIISYSNLNANLLTDINEQLIMHTAISRAEWIIHSIRHRKHAAVMDMVTMEADNKHT